MPLPSLLFSPLCISCQELKGMTLDTVTKSSCWVTSLLETHQRPDLHILFQITIWACLRALRLEQGSLLVLSSILEPSSGMNKGGSGEATLTLRQEVTYTQRCSAAVVLNLVRQKRDFLRAMIGWGKEKGNLIKVVAYSRIFNCKHVRPKSPDVNTACSLTFVVNICSGIWFHPHWSKAWPGIDEYAFN